jgi:RNA polymerase sigma-70 factor (ECF subfamily)
MYRTHFEYVRRTLVKYGVRYGDAGDIAQDVFLAVHEQLGSYDPSRSFKAWLFSFIVHFASDYRRLSRYDREELSGLVSGVGHEGPSAEDTLLADDELRLAAQAIERLPPSRRVVLMMHAEGFTMPEITAKLGIPLNTGYSRLRLARAQARRYAGVWHQIR